MREGRTTGHRAILVGLIVVTALVLVGYGATALAQAPPPEQPKEQFKEEVTVTGTLIPRPTLEALSPVSTLEIEELSYQGITRLEDLLTSLPQVFHSQNSTISNGASGTATINLRYLGSVRTLVLIDGKRMPPGDVSYVAGDLNFIPAALVKRVDILTGGASSTYGADAVAGVVNFILDRDFEGFKGGVMGGGYEHNNSNALAASINSDVGFTYPKGQAWDGFNLDAYAAYGAKFGEGKGHASIYLDYRRTAADLKNRRDYLNCAVTGVDFEAGSDASPYCGGSSTIPAGRFRVYDPVTNRRLGNYVLDLTTGNTLRNRTAADLYNYAPANYMQRPDERWAGGAFLNYEWNPHATGYVDVMLMDDYTDAQIAPSAAFGTPYLLNCDNPMLSAQEKAKLCVKPDEHNMAHLVINRRSVETGPRDDNLNHESFRLLGGVKGKIDKVWSYDVYGLNAQTRVPEYYLHDLSNLKIQDALLVSGNPNDPSTWQCISGNTGCVPWNIFKAGGVTQGAMDYIQIPLLSESLIRTRVVSGKLYGDLRDYGLAFPSATEGIGVAVGGEYRTELLSYQPDQNYIEGNAAGQGASSPAIRGSYSVKEGFAEIHVPIVQGTRGAQDLSLDLGYRYSHYSNNGGWNTWKAQGGWAPLADLKFRAGFNRATRAPNVVELYMPTRVSIGDLTGDPCAGPHPTFTPEQCERTHVHADQYGLIDDNPAHQYNSRNGGNKYLTPEVADTKSFGVVITPSGVPGFTAAFDFYDIKIKDVISTLPGNGIFTQCAMTGDRKYCDLIHRDQFGSLWMTFGGYIDEVNGNFGGNDVRGIDVNLSYTVPFGKSFLGLSLMGGYMDKWEASNVFFKYDCTGYFGNTCQDPTPHWRHLFRATWETGNTTVSLGWRYVGAVTVDEANPSPALYIPDDLAAWKAVGSYHYSAYNFFDLAASYKFGKGVSFLIGVNNVADKEPPMGVGFSGNDYGPGFHGTYDPYGRYIHSSLSFNF